VNCLADRVVAVTGAAGGLGPSVVRRLAADGATIAAADIAADGLQTVGTELAFAPERWDVRALDLLDERATRAWAESVAARFGRVDAVVHLVGGWRGEASIADADPAEYEWLHDMLVRTLQHSSRAFADLLASSGRGRFVMVSSAQAQQPAAGNAAYAAAKAAAEAWTLALGQELAEHGGTANVVVVNAILTSAMSEDNPDKPYSTFTSSEDIADAIAFLLTDSARMMNGQRLALHG
jgi:NAD(P)-dependent dehydrogenase (short-subunit alcohol dehydrogenase family)